MVQAILLKSKHFLNKSSECDQLLYTVCFSWMVGKNICVPHKEEFPVCLISIIKKVMGLCA